MNPYTSAPALREANGSNGANGETPYTFWEAKVDQPCA